MATRNRYAEIMAQYAQSQPFSFTGIPSSYYGGQLDYTGGFNPTPYTPYAAPVNRYADIMAQPAAPMGGGGRGTPEAPSAWSQMTPAERAAYYAANPTEGKIALGIQDLFGNATLAGMLTKNLLQDGFYDSRLEKMGVNPTISVDTQNALAGEAMQRALDSQAQSQANAAAAQASAEAAAQAAAQGDTSDYSHEGRNYGGDRSSDGGGAATGGNNGDASGGGDRGTRGGFAQGGHVSMQHLQGPNPMGPDDGYGALKMGEYVINDKAVKKYGIELMDAINSGKISKGKLLGLLEM
jgi:hypothetical protein